VPIINITAPVSDTGLGRRVGQASRRDRSR
jgi:hypothetical protein